MTFKFLKNENDEYNSDDTSLSGFIVSDNEVEVDSLSEQDDEDNDYIPDSCDEDSEILEYVEDVDEDVENVGNVEKSLDVLYYFSTMTNLLTNFAVIAFSILSYCSKNLWYITKVVFNKLKGEWLANFTEMIKLANFTEMIKFIK